jgi:two-component system NtrC family response regulator
MRPPELPRVLVVDDQPEMATMIAEELAARGWSAEATSSGRHALQRLRQDRFDALVTDVRMPEVGGLELLRVSRELDPTRPVILMTAYSTLELAVQSTSDGAYHCLTKPFRLEALVRLIQQALDRR